VQREDIDVVLLRCSDVVSGEGDSLGATAPLLGAAFAGIVDQDAPHHVGGHAEEVGAIAPLHSALIDEAHIGFVHQRCRLKRVPRRLVPHVSGSETAKVVVDQRHELLKGLTLAVAPRNQELCNPCLVVAAHMPASG